MNKLLEIFFKKIPPEDPKFIIAIIAITFLIISFSFTFIFSIPMSGLLILLIFIILLEYWLWKNNYGIQKVKKGKIGIFFSFLVENEKEKIKLKNNFINCIRREINLRDFNSIIQTRELSDYHSQKINNGSVNLSKFHKATNCHLILYGNFGKGKLNKKPFYFINLNSYAFHKPISLKIRNSFARDMRSVLPNTLLISEENDIEEFKLTSQITKYASLYIIGRALFYSNNIESAFRIHEELLNELSILRKNILIVDTVKKLTINIYLIEAKKLANQSYEIDNNLEKMNIYIEKIKEINPNDYDAKVYKGIYLFLKNRNIQDALSELNSITNPKDGTWLYNMAFLEAYRERLDETYHIYKRASNCHVNDIIFQRIEEFILKLLGNEKEKFQLYYCLGLIFYFKKVKNIEDTTKANKYFTTFIEIAKKENKFINYIKFAEKYLVDVKNIIKKKETKNIFWYLKKFLRRR